MKKTKIIFWVTTLIIVILEGLLPLLTGHSQLAIDGITGLGYPLYFVTFLVVMKVLGAIVLATPRIKGWMKEWAYAGFAFDFIAATVSIWAVSGFNAGILFPLVMLIILMISYQAYHKLKK